MSTVLESIIDGVLEDARERARHFNIAEELSQAPILRDAFTALRGAGLSLIAEVKRASPSKGALAEIADPVALARTYEAAGASVVSVLTEARRFKGSISDLVAVRREIAIPVLRKDFIASEFLVYETRCLGADLMLLIVAGLSESQLRDFYQLATELGMNVLVEVHDEDEIESAMELDPKIIGVNARNLKTLEIDLKAFDRLIPRIPSSVVRIAESGISSSAEVSHVAELGADAILVGETLVKMQNPLEEIQTLLGTRMEG